MSFRHEGPDLLVRIGLVVLLILVQVPAGAAQGIAVDPGTITFNSTTGAAIVNRTVVVTALENVTDLYVITRDLYKADGSKVMPQQAIVAAVPSASMPNGSLRSVSIAFDIGDVSPGLYSGDVWLNSSPGGVTKIPVTATIRNDFWWPATLLVAGVVISYLLFTYNAGMKRRDEIERATRAIEDSAHNDHGLTDWRQYDRDRDADGNPQDGRQQSEYCSTIDYDIGRVREQLLLGNMQEIETAFNTLCADWAQWNKVRVDQVFLLGRFSRVVSGLNALEQQILNRGDPNGPGQGGFVPAIAEKRRELQKAFGALGPGGEGQATLQAFEDSIISADGLHSTLHELMGNLLEVVTLCRKSPTDSPAECGAQQMEDRWNDFKRLAGTGIDDFRKRVDADLKAVRSWSRNRQVTKGPSAVRTEGSEAQVDEQQNPPLTRGQWTGKSRRRRNSWDRLSKWVEINLGPPYRWLEGWLKKWTPWIRLKLYTVGTYAVTVAILAMAGFMQLYLANPTFGATAGDWITLLLWGLLAGAAADTISKNTRTGLGLP